MKKFLINDFEGPLDLLLHLIKQSKMDINDIKIVEITQQYVEFIKNMEELNIINKEIENKIVSYLC